MSDISQEDFDRLLDDIIHERLLLDYTSIPNIHAEIQEFYNNEVLERWEAEQEED